MCVVISRQLRDERDDGLWGSFSEIKVIKKNIHNSRADSLRVFKDKIYWGIANRLEILTRLTSLTEIVWSIRTTSLLQVLVSIPSINGDLSYFNCSFLSWLAYLQRRLSQPVRLIFRLLVFYLPVNCAHSVRFKFCF